MNFYDYESLTNLKEKFNVFDYSLKVVQHSSSLDDMSTLQNKIDSALMPFKRNQNMYLTKQQIAVIHAMGHKDHKALDVKARCQLLSKVGLQFDRQFNAASSNFYMNLVKPINPEAIKALIADLINSNS